jgi:hypothetical protein
MEGKTKSLRKLWCRGMRRVWLTALQCCYKAIVAGTVSHLGEVSVWSLTGFVSCQ